MRHDEMIERAIIDATAIILLLWPFIWFCFKTAGM
jgi:hypothetical protein